MNFIVSECAKCIGWIDSFATAALTHGGYNSYHNTLWQCNSSNNSQASAAHSIAALTWIVAAGSLVSTQHVEDLLVFFC